MCYSTSRLLYPIFAKVRKGNVESCPITGGKPGFARGIYHCLSNEKCALLSKHLRKVMHDGSKLVVCEQLLETSVVARKPDLLMRSSYGGRKRSQQGWIYLLTQHGFLFEEAIHTNPSTLLVFNV